MRRIWALAWKELLQVARDPLSLTMILGVPAFMLVIYGFALSFDVRHIPLAVEDRDRSASSRELIAAFTRSSYFDVVASLLPGADVERLTERGRAKGVLVVPEGFGADLAAGRTGRVQLLLDGTDANTASTALGYATAIAAERSAVLAREAPGAPGRPSGAPVDFRPRVWFNPDLVSSRFLVPGLVGVFLLLSSSMATALSVVREKERGTMAQLRVAPVRMGQILLGKCTPYLGISLLSAFFALALARLLFGVEVKGPILHLTAATLLYLVGGLGYGLMVSTFSSSQAMAFQVTIVTTVLPSVFLSGFIFPIRSMPLPLQWLTYAVPARYFLVILRGVIVKGAGLAPYGSEVGALALYTVAVLAIASLRLARQEG